MKFLLIIYTLLISACSKETKQEQDLRRLVANLVMNSHLPLLKKEVITENKYQQDFISNFKNRFKKIAEIKNQMNKERTMNLFLDDFYFYFEKYYPDYAKRLKKEWKPIIEKCTSQKIMDLNSCFTKETQDGTGVEVLIDISQELRKHYKLLSSPNTSN